MESVPAVRRIRRGILSLATAFALTGVAGAQQMVRGSDPDAKAIIKRIEHVLDDFGPGQTLKCEVEPRQPRMNFAFRYFAGYRAALKLRQFPREQLGLRVVMRVRPDAGSEVYYFYQSFQVPPGRRPRHSQGEFSGGFFLGEGKYTVDWAIVDDAERSCSGSWRTALGLKPEERETADFMEPGAVAPLVLEWSGRPDAHERPFTIAVVLHATPVSPRSLKLTNLDQSFLTTMLTAVLEDTPFQEKALYVVNLEKQDVIFETAQFDEESFVGLMEAMDKLNLGTIGADEYFNPEQRFALLAGIVNRELASVEPPDAIVFIGPKSRHMEKFPHRLVESIPGKRPQFFYLHLDYFSRRFPWADIIERLTKGQGGKVFPIREPRQLMRALDRMEELLERADVEG